MSKLAHNAIRPIVMRPPTPHPIVPVEVVTFTPAQVPHPPAVIPSQDSYAKVAIVAVLAVGGLVIAAWIGIAIGRQSKAVPQVAPSPIAPPSPPVIVLPAAPPAQGCQFMCFGG